MVAMVVTFDKSSVWIMEWFIEHYRNYGLEDFYLSLHVDPQIDDKKQFVESVEETLSNIGCNLFSVYSAKYNAIDHRQHCNAVQEQVRQKHEWIVWADSDELHEFGGPIHDVINRLEDQGRYTLGGHLIDRFSRDHILASPNKYLSPWRQFPLASPVTENVMSGWTCKITLAHADCKIRAGNHLAVEPNEVLCRLQPENFVVPVHHFKWHGAVVHKLEERIAEYREKDLGWWVESDRALSWLRSNDSIRPSGSNVFDYEDDINGEGPFSKNPKYNNGLPFAFQIPDGVFYAS